MWFSATGRLETSRGPRSGMRRRGKVPGIQQELGTPAEGRALVAAAVANFGRLDALVVNHGIWPPKDAPISEMLEAQWRRTMGVNLDSVFGLVQAAVAQMKGRPRHRRFTGEAIRAISY